MLCYVMLCYVMLCYVMLCYVMLCYVMLCYVMLCYVMLNITSQNRTATAGFQHAIRIQADILTKASSKSSVDALSPIKILSSLVFKSDFPLPRSMTPLSQYRMKPNLPSSDGGRSTSLGSTT